MLWWCVLVQEEVPHCRESLPGRRHSHCGTASLMLGSMETPTGIGFEWRCRTSSISLVWHQGCSAVHCAPRYRSRTRCCSLSVRHPSRVGTQCLFWAPKTVSVVQMLTHNFLGPRSRFIGVRPYELRTQVTTSRSRSRPTGTAHGGTSSPRVCGI